MKPHVVPPGQGPDYDWSQDHISVKTPVDLTSGRVSVVEDVLKPGFHLPAHRHRSMAEIFYILDGEVTFAFEDETVIATPGTTLTVPANTRHEVTCTGGGRLLTIFTPGGFERYLAKLAALTPAELEDADRIRELGQRYDIWPEYGRDIGLSSFARPTPLATRVHRTLARSTTSRDTACRLGAGAARR